MGGCAADSERGSISVLQQSCALTARTHALTVRKAFGGLEGGAGQGQTWGCLVFPLCFALALLLLVDQCSDIEAGHSD